MKIEEGYVKINFDDIWNTLSENDKYTFLEDVVYTNEAWKTIVDSLVLDPIIDDIIVSTNYNNHIYEAREKILENLGKIELKHFVSLLHELDDTKRQLYIKDQEYIKLQKLHRDITSENYIFGIGEIYKSVEYPTWVNEESIKKYFE